MWYDATTTKLILELRYARWNARSNARYDDAGIDARYDAEIDARYDTWIDTKCNAHATDARYDTWIDIHATNAWTTKR